MLELALANITGNIPCVCFVLAGVYLIKSGYFGPGLFLLIMAACAVTRYKKGSNKQRKNEREKNNDTDR